MINTIYKLRVKQEPNFYHNLLPKKQQLIINTEYFYTKYDAIKRLKSMYPNNISATIITIPERDCKNIETIKVFWDDKDKNKASYLLKINIDNQDFYLKLAKQFFKS